MTETFDVIVVGGGMAGAACAASLALRGVKPLLVAETERLGHNLRAIEIDGHRAISQFPWWHISDRGGHWARVAREQNLPTRVHPELKWLFSTPGGSIVELPMVLSSSSVCQALFELLPIPLHRDPRRDFERIMHEGFAIPWRELLTMDDIPMTSWLAEHEAAEMTRTLLGMLASLTGMPPELALSATSVLGSFGILRSLVGGESFMAGIEPDPQVGLVEPLGTRVVELGGAVWRGTGVAQVLTSDGRVRGVLMKDGREAEADVVALAVGNKRLAGLFDHLPGELVEPLRKEAPFDLREMYEFVVLKEPVVSITAPLAILTPAGLIFLAPLHASSPWNCPDDRQLCSIWMGLGTRGQGGGSLSVEAAVSLFDETLEGHFPGWTGAVQHRRILQHHHHWLSPMLAGPKVPRRSPTVGGLWYVGEGTAPVGGFGVEQAAFAGYDGALVISEALGSTALNDDRLLGICP